MNKAAELFQTHLRPHAKQFLTYLVSGGSAAALQIGTLKALLLLGIDYKIAGLGGSIVGAIAAFIFHKYFVFQKKENTTSHTVRYLILSAFNFIAQYFLYIGFVSVLHMSPVLAQVLSIGCSVCWNFFLYKFLVYV